MSLSLIKRTHLLQTTAWRRRRPKTARSERHWRRVFSSEDGQSKGVALHRRAVSETSEFRTAPCSPDIASAERMRLSTCTWSSAPAFGRARDTRHAPAPAGYIASSTQYDLSVVFRRFEYCSAYCEGLLPRPAICDYEKRRTLVLVAN
jgi:hypothetical protein